MYSLILAVHNVLRWIVLIFLVVALVRSYWGWFSKRERTPIDRKVGMFYSISLDIQLLFGLILYFLLSPIVSLNLSNFGSRLVDEGFRFLLWSTLC